MKIRKAAAGILLAGISTFGVFNQASASTFADFSDVPGMTCPMGKITIQVTQNSGNDIIWNMDSSTVSRDRCYAKVNSMYSDHYSSKWNNATAECSSMWEQQVKKVAQSNANIRESYHNCNNISDYIFEQVGDRY